MSAPPRSGLSTCRRSACGSGRRDRPAVTERIAGRWDRGGGGGWAIFFANLSEDDLFHNRSPVTATAEARMTAVRTINQRRREGLFGVVDSIAVIGLAWMNASAYRSNKCERLSNRHLDVLLQSCRHF